ncbi:hypothetical protein FHU20_001246 [Clostridium saccharobutylicum]|nr:hypothetical protein [Clostridium saccharobutylicum]MBA8895889.1 hypothetical protein [Clostridium saccharobutylicum]MBA8981028.1 hypothetical protein [Clostridium saccharobutylicum]NOV80676.1 hypothetical protein [Clostridium saccharobutylicum]NSA17965.1 hypothetical protein [Clostridium saccharobutylicum]
MFKIINITSLCAISGTPAKPNNIFQLSALGCILLNSI